mmetsp:Transcript_78366/g.243007  ORF Transcript_78366/g.243007 Transcript_78366/m.243007 type:complete len:486 (-) Transcript_78366:111-1568(-)
MMQPRSQKGSGNVPIGAAGAGGPAGRGGGVGGARSRRGRGGDRQGTTADAAPCGEGQDCATKNNELDFQKQVARRLLDALDEDSLWQLAGVLQRRGLIRALPNGLEAVPKPAGAASRSAADAGNHSLHVPVQPDAVDCGAVVPTVAPAAASPPTASWKSPSAHSAQTQGAAAAPMHDSCGSELGNNAENGKLDEGNATTLILRNLPPYFDQMTTQEWVDSKGYPGLYDFLLWFPAKKTSRLNTSSYAFVNFRDASHAIRFRQEHHLERFPSQDGELGKKQQWPLSIAVAKVQGFMENYVRFHHLTNDTSPTLCQPFFAQDAIDTLSQETRVAAAAAATNAPQLDNLQEGPCTTLIIRNLPYVVDSQDVARQWFDGAGFGGQYDFFLYLPAKRRRPETASQGGAPQGLAYAFVNFRATNFALNCAEALNGRALAEGDPALNVVAAKVQGLEECISHFSSLSENGRVVPWHDASASAGRCPQPRQYQ